MQQYSLVPVEDEDRLHGAQVPATRPQPEILQRAGESGSQLQTTFAFGTETPLRRSFHASPVLQDHGEEECRCAVSHAGVFQETAVRSGKAESNRFHRRLP